jgi:ribosomal protein L29
MSKIAQSLTALRDQPDDELAALLVKTRDDLFRLQLGQYTNQVTSTAGLTTKRRDIARIMTILRGRSIGTEKQAQKSETKVEAAPAEATPDKKSKSKKAASEPKAPKAAKKAKS